MRLTPIPVHSFFIRNSTTGERNRQLFPSTCNLFSVQIRVVMHTDFGDTCLNTTVQNGTNCFPADSSPLLNDHDAAAEEMTVSPFLPPQRSAFKGRVSVSDSGKVRELHLGTFAQKSDELFVTELPLLKCWQAVCPLGPFQHFGNSAFSFKYP